MNHSERGAPQASKYSYEYFKKITTQQVKANGFIAASTGLEILAYIARLEKETELPR